MIDINKMETEIVLLIWILFILIKNVNKAEADKIFQN